MRLVRRAALLLPLLLAAPAGAQTAFPGQREGTWTAPGFRFHSGETVDLRQGYVTLGDPANPAVLILHGTGGTARGMLAANFGGQLFGPGQPLDATRHFVVIPDSIGTGNSSKPSDGLRAAFPRYTYDDMVAAQHRLVTEGLGIRRLRLVLGNSMGGMMAWTWATNFPDMMDAIVPMASQPTAMSSRNWMMRRLMIETVRQDPAYMGGNYTTQPPSLRIANVMYGTGTNGGTLNLQRLAPTREAADRLVDQRLSAPPPRDANDFLWQWDASRDYDPEPRLDRIRARVLAINSADDERNPPETGLTERAIARIPNARLLLIPASAETLGHGTTGNARFWRDDLARFLATLP
ncbi:alpha/beta fold hydrolase [Roseomonas sp. PWR1]|uniref:Alpha/beta fold hydrolase n=1 Tax=Roseomonas nitratireducens TaxID=2820810 RepID=A0ABS4AUW7_9PROT|nr:alpha/beta fold hydrolase [Neoroseomonas nitratireducens]MBP0465154.1 alpha/beta fold hydrolase [Neoroseomonas nitratireducens]